MADRPSLPERVVATSKGEFTGEDIVEVLTGIRGELGAPHLGVLPELPERGFSATRTARTIACLEGLHADGLASGWRLRTSPSRESRAAGARWRADVNALADVVGTEASGHRGHTVVTLVGPGTLAAEMELANGESAVSDHGARRDLRDSLCAGLAEAAAALRTAVGGEPLAIRWVEPRLAEVLEGRVPTASGLRTLRSVPREEVRTSLAAIAEASHRHGLAAFLETDGGVPDPEFLAPFDAFAVRPRGFDAGAWEPVAAAVEGGHHAILGITPDDETDPTVRLARGIWRTWREVGLGEAEVRRLIVEEREVLTGTAWSRARRVLGISTGIAEALHETSRE